MKRTTAKAAGLKRLFGAAAAAGLALAVGFGAVPASAVAPVPVAPPEDSASELPAADGTESPTAGGGLREAGLSEAAHRDLGLAPGEFAAAGQLGKQAADVAAGLRDVPGYLGTRIEDGTLIVTGSGHHLEAAVAQLSVDVPALALEAPEAQPPSNAPADASGAPTPAGAESGTELAHSTQQLYQSYLREVGPAGLQAVAYTGSSFVIRTGGVNASQAGQDGDGSQESAGAHDPVAAQDPVAANPADGTAGDGAAGTGTGGKISAAEFVARYANVELDAGPAVKPEADLSGGEGYFTDIGRICSAGYSVFDPAGLPGVLTAGHCADDGTATTATVEFPQWNRAERLGTFSFSQFGGAGNSPVLRPDNDENPGNVGTDIAVLDDLRADLDPRPAASTWGDPLEAGPDRKVIGTAAPVVGMRVCRSGRSSAWSCGNIDEVGIYVVQGATTAPADLRAFTGFLSWDVQSGGGDSGGPWVSGNYAVGVHNAGDVPDESGNVVKNFAVAATLVDALAVLPGYQLELFLNRPVVTSPAPGATFDAGQTVTGVVAAAPASAVAAGSTVRVTLAGEAPFEVPVDAFGAWSFTAPATSGSLRFTAETVNGYSASGAAAFDFAAVAPDVPGTPIEETPVEPPATAEFEVPAPAEVPAAGGAPASSGAAVVVLPLGEELPANLANTGVSGLILAAGLAAAALAVGGVLLALARRRKRQRPTPTR